MKALALLLEDSSDAMEPPTAEVLEDQHTRLKKQLELLALVLTTIQQSFPCTIILLGKLPVSKTPVFKSLLNTYEEVTSKISAVGAPFDKKDILKQRGYRWNDGSQGGCKAWWTCVPSVLENEELTWLASEIYSDSSTDRVEISRINAIDRFSVREK